MEQAYRTIADRLAEAPEWFDTFSFGYRLLCNKNVADNRILFTANGMNQPFFPINIECDIEDQRSRTEFLKLLDHVGELSYFESNDPVVNLLLNEDLAKSSKVMNEIFFWTCWKYDTMDDHQGQLLLF